MLPPSKCPSTRSISSSASSMPTRGRCVRSRMMDVKDRGRMHRHDDTHIPVQTMGIGVSRVSKRM